MRLLGKNERPVGEEGVLPLTHADLRAFSDQIIRIQQVRVNRLVGTTTASSILDEALDRFHQLLLERAELEAYLAAAQEGQLPIFPPD